MAQAQTEWLKRYSHPPQHSDDPDGLLLSLFVLSRSLGLTWRSYSFGIALGYGTYAAIDFLLAAIRASTGKQIWQTGIDT